jgi:hypothetical protein
MTVAVQSLCDAFWEGATSGRRGNQLLRYVHQKFPDASFESIVKAAFTAVIRPLEGRDAAHSAIYDVAIKNRGLPQLMARFD